MLNDYEIEMRQRVTRIESRICRIADGLNIPTADPSKSLHIRYIEDKGVVIDTEVMDVSLSSIIRFLTKEGIEDKVVMIYFEGALVAQVFPKGRK
jgi:hypothetical protein